MTCIADRLEMTKADFAIPLTVDLTDQHRNDKPVTKSSENPGQPIHHRAISPINHPEPREPENLRLLMEPLPGQTTAFHQMQPHKADEITIDNPEFKRPPGKIKKLTLAIKIFSKSFKTMSCFNNPETDRSARVETIRNRVFTGTAAVLDILTGAIILKGFIRLMGACRNSGESDTILLDIFVAAIAITVMFGAFGIGWLLSQGISRLVTSTVAASVDTREKLAEMTAFTSPKERFLKKYQRTEESLTVLKTKLIDAELSSTLRHSETSEEEREAREQAKLDTKALNPGTAEDKWYDSLQRYYLREWYEFYQYSSEELKDEIGKTEDWLNRAAKQKERLCNEQELQKLNTVVADENPAYRARM
ncbi:hypothetical protein [Endozoicomonas acroporae]|uniref:hypothetical protein n=1 Tax=Endozoicomonas acroporae TaxID=1701104 RepID=UPI003D7BD39C